MVAELLPKMKGKRRKEGKLIHSGPEKFCEIHISVKLARLVGAR